MTIPWPRRPSPCRLGARERILERRHYQGMAMVHVAAFRRVVGEVIQLRTAGAPGASDPGHARESTGPADRGRSPGHPPAERPPTRDGRRNRRRRPEGVESRGACAALPGTGCDARGPRARGCRHRKDFWAVGDRQDSRGRLARRRGAQRSRTHRAPAAVGTTSPVARLGRRGGRHRPGGRGRARDAARVHGCPRGRRRAAAEATGRSPAWSARIAARARRSGSRSDWLRGTVDLAPTGEIVVDDHGRTSVPGVFATGDRPCAPHCGAVSRSS